MKQKVRRGAAPFVFKGAGFSLRISGETRWALSVVLAVLFCAALSAQTPPNSPQPPSPEVLILALQALTPHAELQQHLGANLFSDSPATLAREKQLLEIQMNIVRAAAPFAPVLLLAPDESTQAALHDRCAELQICSLLASDRVRIKIVLHDDVWVRDFGPQISAAGDSASVVHWRYFDIRTEEAKREKLQQLEAARLRLLQIREQQTQAPQGSDALDPNLTPDARKAIASTIEDKLYVLREFSQLLNETSPQRTNDDSSAYDIADAVLVAPDFHFTKSPLALDGGNLFKLDDGRCLTTRALLSRNKDQSVNVDQELAKTAGCQSITYLEPLPGGVIEHVDMFLLPAGGKRLLLASYDLSSPFASEYWPKLSDAERDLTLHASLAMQANADRLRQLGYDVILVPSPFPQIPANGHTYYPAVLNALILHSTDGAATHLLIPSFGNFEPDIQSAAQDQIKSAFGPHTELIPIEATAAAESQGAIHCLTLTAPLQLSIFADTASTARRAAALTRKSQLDQSAAAQIAAKIPATSLQGTWSITETSNPGRGATSCVPARQDPSQSAAPSSPDLSPQRIFFTSTEFQRGASDRLAYSGAYVIDQRNAATWSLHLIFANHQTTPAEARWLSPNEIQLTLNHGDHTWLLHRLNSNTTSPFKPVATSNQSSSKPATPNKSKSPTPAKPSLQRIDPPNQP